MSIVTIQFNKIMCSQIGEAESQTSRIQHSAAAELGPAVKRQREKKAQQRGVAVIKG